MAWHGCAGAAVPPCAVMSVLEGGDLFYDAKWEQPDDGEEKDCAAVALLCDRDREELILPQEHTHALHLDQALRRLRVCRFQHAHVTSSMRDRRGYVQTWRRIHETDRRSSLETLLRAAAGGASGGGGARAAAELIGVRLAGGGDFLARVKVAARRCRAP